MKNTTSPVRQRRQKERIQFEEIKRCPFCGGENLLFDSAAIISKETTVFPEGFLRGLQTASSGVVRVFVSVPGNVEWDRSYEKLHENLKKRQEQLAIQLHKSGDTLHTSDAYRLNHSSLTAFGKPGSKIRRSTISFPDRF
jgi:hypothetical protein